MRNFVIGVVLLIIGVLIGFIPQYAKAHRLQQQVESCRAELRLAQVRQSAALMYIATSQLNYGNASGYAAQFFDQAQSLAGSAPDAGLRSRFTEIVSSRGKITDDLSKGNAGVLGEMQPLVMKVEQAAAR
jgi:hypothetical protein